MPIAVTDEKEPAALRSTEVRANGATKHLDRADGAARMLREPPDVPRESDPQVYRSLVHLFRKGHAASAATGASRRSLLPLHLFAYGDLAYVRTPFPVALSRAGDDVRVYSFEAVVTEASASLDAEGDERGVLERALLRLEVLLRGALDAADEVDAGEAWRAAAEKVAAMRWPPSLPLERLRAALETPKILSGAHFFGCTPALAEAILRQTAVADVMSRSTIGQGMVRMEAALRQLLEVDAARRPEATTEPHLRESVGAGSAEDFDFASLSAILEIASHEPPLSGGRRERVERLLAHLVESRALFAGAQGTDPVVVQATSCTEAAAQASALKQRVVDVTRTIRQAQLELQHRYRPEQHDAYFAEFGWEDLSEEERRSVPPVLLFVDANGLRPGDTEYLFELLSCSLPVKVLLTVHRVFDTPATPVLEAPALTSPASIAWRAVALHSAFVLQSALSDLPRLANGVEAGMRYDGPALFSVYTGREGPSPGLHPYLKAAVAVESRAFPAFRYDPDGGPTWSDRFSMDGNPQPEYTWSSGAVSYIATDGSEQTSSLAFTAADFLACDPACRRYTKAVPASMWDERMTPLDQYLEAPLDARKESIPYILLYEADGTIWRAVVTRAAVRSVESVRERWHLLREMGGIGNSLVEAALARERAALDAAARIEMQRLRDEHARQLDEAYGSMAHTIVSNLAASLLEMPVTAPIASASTTPPTVVARGPGEAAEQRPAALPPPAVDAPAGDKPLPTPEEDGALSFDDPYIETPRCTTCNECTNLNGLMFAYDGNKQAYIKDASAGTFRDLVVAAEKCPVRIIHPGKPLNPDEPDLPQLIQRAEAFQ